MPVSERTPLRRHHSTNRYNLQTPTFPSYHSSRHKPRRWPLVLRFIKGAIHIYIAIPVLLHVAFTLLIVHLDRQSPNIHLGLPSSTIPSLSIVVGLMLVFRNSTSYDRFWQGSQHLNVMCTTIRNLTRSFLTCSYSCLQPKGPTPAERADTERSVRLLLALLYATKNHLRSEYGPSDQLLPNVVFSFSPFSTSSPSPSSTFAPEAPQASFPNSAPAAPAPPTEELSPLLPPGTQQHEEAGLGLVPQLTLQLEAYIKRGHDRGWFHAPQAAQLTAQLNELVRAYGAMETIHLTPLPVAYLVHTRQVLALFCGVLPFAFAPEQGWWSALTVGFVAFTLYGIEAIGVQLEDPFGYDRNDIKVDAIAEDLRVETGVLLEEWRRGGDMFPPRFVLEKKAEVGESRAGGEEEEEEEVGRNDRVNGKGVWN